MANKLYSFDPNLMQVMVNGDTIIGGYAESFITITRTDSMWNTQIGADGSTMRVKTNNRTSDITLTLQQSSPSMATLDFLATADEETAQGVFQINIVYKDPKGDVPIIESTSAYIEKKPDSSFSNAPQDREWVIKCADAIFTPSATAYNDHFFKAGVTFKDKANVDTLSEGYSRGNDDYLNLPNPFA